MWQIISNVSSIVTCLLFVLYIVGHIWKVIVTKDTRYEKFKILPFDTGFDADDNDNSIIIDEAGELFSLSSSYGIRNIKLYKVEYMFNDNGTTTLVSKELKHTCKGINISDTLYIKCELGEIIPTTQIEIERMDYTRVTFELYTSGKNGNILVENYKFKMTLKCFIYYLSV